MIDRLALAALAAAFTLGLAGCEREGPVERAGEEVDEGIDNLRGEEPTAGERVEDAAEEVREGTEEAAEEARGN